MDSERKQSPEKKDDFAAILSACLQMNSDAESLFEKNKENIFLTMCDLLENKKLGVLRRIFDKPATPAAATQSSPDPAKDILRSNALAAIDNFDYTGDEENINAFLNGLEDDLIKSEDWQKFWKQIQQDYNKEKKPEISAVISELQKLLISAYGFRVISSMFQNKTAKLKVQYKSQQVKLTPYTVKNKQCQDRLGERRDQDDESVNLVLKYIRSAALQFHTDHQKDEEFAYGMLGFSILSVLDGEILYSPPSVVLRSVLDKMEKLTPLSELNKTAQAVKFILADPKMNSKEIFADPMVARATIAAAQEQIELEKRKASSVAGIRLPAEQKRDRSATMAPVVSSELKAKPKRKYESTTMSPTAFAKAKQQAQSPSHLRASSVGQTMFRPSPASSSSSSDRDEKVKVQSKDDRLRADVEVVLKGYGVRGFKVGPIKIGLKEHHEDVARLSHMFNIETEQKKDFTPRENEFKDFTHEMKVDALESLLIKILTKSWKIPERKLQGAIAEDVSNANSG